MQTRRLRRALLAVLVTSALLVVGAPWADAGPPRQPGQPTSGFGSRQGYIATGATKYETGSGSAGTRVWWYVPNRLRNGSSAPVVVFLHGFMLLAPEIYQGHIDHLTRQGYIVIFPQFNKGGLIGLMTDTDQNQMLQRAIDATNVALARLGGIADRTNVHLYGHSLGGLMGASWLARGGAPIRSATLANPSIDAGAAIPSFVRGLVRITPIDVAATARAHTVRTIIITGDQDTIAKPAESLTLAGLMTAAPSKVVYQARSDATGTPAIKADHMAPIQNDGWLPSFLADLFGGTGEQDTLDWRVYYAALDANLAGQPTLTFDMGTWSNGVPVAAPTRLL